MEPEGSLSLSQTPATSVFPDPARSSPYPHIPLHEDPIIFLPSTSGSSKWSLSLRFLHQNPVYIFTLPIRATCSAHFIVLDFITRKIEDEEYKSLSSSLCIFLHPLVTSSLLGPNILHNTLLSNTLSLRSSLIASDQVSHPYKTGKIIIPCILVFVFFYIKLEDAGFCTEWQQANNHTSNNGYSEIAGPQLVTHCTT